jgi:hypothetical protein
MILLMVVQRVVETGKIMAIALMVLNVNLDTSKYCCDLLSMHGTLLVTYLLSYAIAI